MGDGDADSEFATFVLARSHGWHIILLYAINECILNASSPLT